jgi:hypothetical protein
MIEQFLKAITTILCATILLDAVEHPFRTIFAVVVSCIMVMITFNKA